MLVATPSLVPNQGNAVSGPIISAGKVFYLDSSAPMDADALYTYSNVILAGTPQAPFTTAAFALAQCTANQGDTIVVGKGHAESLATLLAANSKSGVTFVHLGFGVTWMTETPANNMRGPSNFQSARKAAALITTGVNNLFNIVGSIRILEIYGLVEVVFPGTACTLRLGLLPTGLTETFICAASASIASATVGTTVSIDGVAANAMIISPNQSRLAQVNSWIGHTGVLRTTNSASPATGTISWHMLYQPITPSSYAIAV